MFRTIFGKRWLQTRIYMPRMLDNAIEHRYEKYSVLIGTLLLFAALSVVPLTVYGLQSGSFGPDLAFLLAVIGVFCVYIGVHNLRIRRVHEILVKNFTSEWRYRYLFSEDDLIYQSIMFPSYIKYLDGRDRESINMKAWSILEDYARSALEHWEIISMEMAHPDCSDSERRQLEEELQEYIHSIAHAAGLRIAALLGLDPGSFFKDRARMIVKTRRHNN